MCIRDRNRHLPGKRLENLVALFVGIGKVALPLAHDFIQGALRDINPALSQQRGREAVEHGENECADLKAVHIGIGADDDFAVAQCVQVKGGKLLVALGLCLHPAAHHAQQVDNDVVFEDFVKVAFEAVENFPAHRDDGLKLGVPALLAGAQGRRCV